MRWLRFIWFKILKCIGIPMTSIHKECISKLENQLSEIDDDEYHMALTMLDVGIKCDLVLFALLLARRKRAFIRKLKQFGIKGTNLEYLIEKYLPDLKNTTIKVDELVTKASQEYEEALEKKRNNLSKPK